LTAINHRNAKPGHSEGTHALANVGRHPLLFFGSGYWHEPRLYARNAGIRSFAAIGFAGAARK
jgi:hypothetical protein